MITEFQGEFRFLSNFIGGVEQKYQAAKAINIEDAKRILQMTAGQSKREGRKIPIRADWETIKVEVMEGLLREKFMKEPFRSQLIATGTKHIQEGNRWGDTFWGVDLRTGEGQNILGRLIMEIRQELRDSSITT